MNAIFKATEQWEMTHEWITQGDIKQRTILHFAAIYGYMGVATCIVNKISTFTKNEEEMKQYLNIQDYKGRTPLFYAAAEGWSRVTKLLVTRGAALEICTNEKHIQPGSTPLMACCEKNTPECSKVLLDHGASIAHTRKDGADATYIAARYGHLEVIEQIIERENIETIINRPTFRGRTALLTAAFHGHILVVRQLFKAGWNLDQQDDIKFTALMYAANEGYHDLVKWLITNGANTRKKDLERKTAYQLAVDNNHIKVVKHLKQFEEEEENDSAQKGSVTRQKKKRRVDKMSKMVKYKKILL